MHMNATLKEDWKTAYFLAPPRLAATWDLPYVNLRVKPQTVSRTLTTKTFRASVLPPYQRKQLHCCPSFGKICQVLVADNIGCCHGAEKWVILRQVKVAPQAG